MGTALGRALGNGMTKSCIWMGERFRMWPIAFLYGYLCGAAILWHLIEGFSGDVFEWVVLAVGFVLFPGALVVTQSHLWCRVPERGTTARLSRQG